MDESKWRYGQLCQYLRKWWWALGKCYVLLLIVIYLLCERGWGEVPCKSMIRLLVGLPWCNVYGEIVVAQGVIDQD